MKQLRWRSLWQASEPLPKAIIVLPRWFEKVPMQLEDYFMFLASDDIRIKGTRIGIEAFSTNIFIAVKRRKRLLNSFIR